MKFVEDDGLKDISDHYGICSDIIFDAPNDTKFFEEYAKSIKTSSLFSSRLAKKSTISVEFIKLQPFNCI